MSQSLISRRDALRKSSAAILGASLWNTLGDCGTKSVYAEQPAEDSSRKIRIGIVGGGFGCAFHWHEHPDCEVTGVSDLRPDRRQALRQRYQCDRVYDSLEIMIQQAKDIDAVAIFTEAPNHEKHVRMCFERGWHVISAVPACISLEEAQRMKEAAHRTGLKYMMAETSYYRPYCIAARELFLEGKFGDLFYSEVEYYHPSIGYPTSPLSFHDGQRTWRYGYPPMLYPTHSTGYLIGVTQERLTEVSCVGWGNPENPALRDNDYQNPFSSASALFRTNRGHACRCNVFWDGTAEGERAQWFGTQLTFYTPNSGGQPFRLDGPSAPEWTTVPDYRSRLPAAMAYDSGHGGSHPFLTHEFIRALREDRPPAIDLEVALAMTVPGIVAHQSALQDGLQLKVPGFDQL